MGLHRERWARPGGQAGAAVPNVQGYEGRSKKALATFQHEVDRGLVVSSGHLTVAEWLQGWLEQGRTMWRPKTVDRYESICRVHLVPHLGAVKLARLTRAQCKEAEAKVRSTGVSPQTVIHVHRCLAKALADAMEADLLAANPARYKVAQAPSREMAYLDEGQAAALLAAAREDQLLAMPVTLALGLGLRRGEVLGLRWRDLDLDRAQASVRQTLQVTNAERLHFGPPKTRERNVALPTFVVESLRAHRLVQTERRLLLGPAWQETDLICDNGDGGPLNPERITNCFRGLARRLGHERLTFHSLRHSHAVLMLRAGIHPKVASERLGHSRISITMDLYSHSLPDMQADAARAVDELLATRSAALPS